MSSCLDNANIEDLDEEERLEIERLAIERLENELAVIDTFLIENNITAEIDTLSGLRYVIHEQGTGKSPVDSSIITVKFEGSFFDGSVFDSSESVTLSLSQLILC